MENEFLCLYSIQSKSVLSHPLVDPLYGLLHFFFSDSVLWFFATRVRLSPVSHLLAASRQLDFQDLINRTCSTVPAQRRSFWKPHRLLQNKFSPYQFSAKSSRLWGPVKPCRKEVTDDSDQRDLSLQSPKETKLSVVALLLPWKCLTCFWPYTRRSLPTHLSVIFPIRRRISWLRSGVISRLFLSQQEITAS